MKKDYNLNIDQISKLIEEFYYSGFCTDYMEVLRDDKLFKIWLKKEINGVTKR